MFEMPRKALKCLNKKEKRYLLIVLIPVLINSLFEIVGIASIVPFMSIVADPSSIYSNEHIHGIYNYFNFKSEHSFIYFFGICVLGFIVVGNLFGLATAWTIIKLTTYLNRTVSNKLFSIYMQQPYEFFIKKNSSELVKNVFTEVNTYSYLIKSYINLVSRIIAIICISTLICIANPLIALYISISLMSIYCIIYLSVKVKLIKIGVQNVTNHRQRFKILQEAFNSIKIIKLLQNETTFTRHFSESTKKLFNNTATLSTIGIIPKYLMEMFAFCGVIIIILFLISTHRNTADIISLIALYTFSGYRLMPHLQQAYTSITEILSSKESLNIVYNDFNNLRITTPSHVNSQNKSNFIKDFKAISLNKIAFSHSNRESPIISNLNMVIRRNTTIGIIGTTGAGKTTCIDIIIGLLKPSQGTILVDGTVMDYRFRDQWKKAIGYVPQDVCLIDDTIAKNIAFGIDEKDIDYTAVANAAKIARLDNFILDKLPCGYNTIIGERGVQLSGGQRQRIGIARAMYYDPEVLVLDEATNALDMLTEREIINTIFTMTSKKTIIIIAHRIPTIMKCDAIYIFENGSIIDSGTYSELINNSSHFKKIAAT